jgi:PBSX family phage terminase large subunit
MPFIQPFQGKALEAYTGPVQRLNLWDGSVRSGKTLNSLMRWARWVREDAPPGGLMIVSKTERTAKQNIVDPLRQIFGDRLAKYSAGNHELILFGRRHMIVGAADARSEGKIRGITLAGMYDDEMTLNPESFFTMALSRLSLPGAALFGTTNPDSPVHWLKRRYLDRAADLDLRRWHFILEDNPYLDPDYVRQLKAEYQGLWHKRYILGEWAVAEGAIYDGLDEEVHQVEELPDTNWTYAGVRHGISTPTVFVALSGTDNGLIAHHEYRHDSRETGRQKTMTEYSAEFSAWRETLPQPADKVYVDPSASALILQLWRDGVRGVHPAEDNAVTAGIMETAALLGAERLRIHRPSVDAGWQELASYAWDPKASERGEDLPLRQLDHFPDALRFVTHGARNRWRHLLDAVPVAA